MAKTVNIKVYDVRSNICLQEIKKTLIKTLLHLSKNMNTLSIFIWSKCRPMVSILKPLTTFRKTNLLRFNEPNLSGIDPNNSDGVILILPTEK